MTERLYDNSAVTVFEAVVTGCDEAGGCYEVTLDRSAFFPEGGGQEGDIGTIGSVRVTDTTERGGEVIHKCSAPLPVGERVRGEVDYMTRLRRMQNHSGEHLLMGFIHNRHGLDNVGFRIGSKEVTLDINGVLSPEELTACEQLANEAIAKDLPITISYPAAEELSAMTYRSKLGMTENVRLVTIEGVDVCACCAPHAASTGMIGIIRIVSAENYKGGMRLHILSGLDALDLFRQRCDSVSEISRLLSAKPERTAEYVRKLYDENLALKHRLAADEQLRTDEVIASLGSSRRGSFCVFVSGLSADSMRRIANEAVKLTDGAAGVFCQQDEGHSYIIASSKLKLRALTGEINRSLGGKGGGSDSMIQGTASAGRETIERCIAAL